MTTPLAICSAALLMIGADEISSFDEGSREAKLCANLYDTTRDELLQLYPWRFAVGQVQLARLTDSPLFGYRYAYQLPADMLRLIGTDNDLTYRVFENRLFSDASSLRITYLFRVSEARLPAYFVRTVELKMAEILAIALQEDLAKSRLLSDKADKQLIRARAIDAQQQTTAQLPEHNFLLSSARD